MSGKTWIKYWPNWLMSAGITQKNYNTWASWTSLWLMEPRSYKWSILIKYRGASLPSCPLKSRNNMSKWSWKTILTKIYRLYRQITLILFLQQSSSSTAKKGIKISKDTTTQTSNKKTFLKWIRCLILNSKNCKMRVKILPSWEIPTQQSSFGGILGNRTAKHKSGSKPQIQLRRLFRPSKPTPSLTQLQSKSTLAKQIHV